MFWPFVSSAHASTATATASLYFLSAWYCSALPPRCIFLHICLWPRRQWSCWQVESQYLNLHLTQRGASWASGAAQAAQFVRIIFVWRSAFGRFRAASQSVGLLLVAYETLANPAPFLRRQ